MDLQRLAAELAADPNGYGYSGMDAAAAAAALNLVRDGSAGTGAALTLRLRDVSGKDVWEAILVTDFPALAGNPTAAALSSERRYLAWLSGLPALATIRLQHDNGTNTPAADNLLAMFPAGSGTRTRLVALATRNVSRAEQLGLGRVEPGHVIEARAFGGS